MPNRHRLCTRSPSISLLLLLFIFFFFVSFHGVRSAFSTVCDPASSFLCGNFTVRYPFWNDSNAVFHCGYPGLGLECPYGYHYPTLSLPGDTYFVTDINYDDKTLTLVDIDVAGQGQGCLRARHNLTIGSLPLGYNSADVNLTFFFNCSAPPSLYSPFVAIDCLRFGEKQSYVFLNKRQEEAEAFDAELDCEETVVTAVKGSEVTAANVVDQFAGAMSQGFVLDWVAAKDCSACEHSGGRCAFNQNDQLLCFCNDGSNHTDGSFCRGKRMVGLKIGIGMAASGAGIVVTLILMLSFWKKPLIRRIMALVKQRSKYFDGEMKMEGLVSLRRYTYKDIKRMTNSFKEKLGQGGYGSVYKGKLRDGQLVAVKLLRRLTGDAEEFFNEVASINRTSHVNVVNLLGFCFEGSKRALIYEFMPNGSLEKFIFNRSNTLEVDQQLNWDTLYQISLGIAHGLEYLHKGCKNCDVLATKTAFLVS